MSADSPGQRVRRSGQTGRTHPLFIERGVRLSACPAGHPVCQGGRGAFEIYSLSRETVWSPRCCAGSK